MKIVLLNKSLLSGGIEKCIENLDYYLHEEYELEIVYLDKERLDENIVKILEKNAKVTYLQEQIIKCDLCIFCYLYFDYEKVINKIKANTYLCWVHSKPRELENCLLDNSEFVNKISEFICVSNEIKKSLQISKEGTVIHNFINDDIQQLATEKNPFEQYSDDVLKLVVVSRLSNGKGFDRLLKLVEALERKSIKYHLKVIGKGRAKEQEIRESFASYKNVIFEGYKDNPYCYIKNADYLVQLSDYESWGNVITEAKALGVPCLITDFPSAKEQINNNENGIIVSLNLESYEYIVDEMVEKKEKLKKNLKNFQYYNETENWNKLLKKYML